MIDLEKHIKEQRLLMDVDQPREGHEDRFREKLAYQPARKVNFRHAMQIAASIAVILASAIVLIRSNQSGDKVAVMEIPASVIEADIYYTTQVDQKVDEIRQFDFDNAEEKTLLLEELEELDAYQLQLMNDLEANPDDERVVNALIKHYQIKLDVMDQIIYQLNQLKTETEKDDEKKSI